MNSAVARVSLARPTALLCITGVVVAWLVMVIVDPADNDGAGPLWTLFGIPSVIAAIVIQLFMPRMGRKEKISPGFLWWLLGFLPLGILGALLFAMPQNRDYFGDDPWMLIWLVVFVYCALLLGAIVWFFLVFPLATVAGNVAAAFRGEASWASTITPLPLIALGAFAVFMAFAVDFDTIGRWSWPIIIAAVFGLPGNYDLVWVGGLWIARLLLLGVLAVWLGPWLLQRLRERRVKP